MGTSASSLTHDQEGSAVSLEATPSLPALREYFGLGHDRVPIPPTDINVEFLKLKDYTGRLEILSPIPFADGGASDLIRGVIPGVKNEAS